MLRDATMARMPPMAIDELQLNLLSTEGDHGVLPCGKCLPDWATRAVLAASHSSMLHGLASTSRRMHRSIQKCLSSGHQAFATTDQMYVGRLSLLM